MIEKLAADVAVLKWAISGIGTILTLFFMWIRGLSAGLKKHEIDVAKNYFSKEDGLRMKQDIIREITELKEIMKGK